MALPPLPEEIVRLIERSPGRIFCRKQVHKAGFGDGHLARWREKGWTERMAPGWHRAVGDVQPVDQRFQLAWEYLRLSSGGALVRFSGAGALGLMGVPGFEVASIDPLVLLQDGDRVRIDGMPFRVRHTDLSEVPRPWARRLPAVTAARALADLHAAESWERVPLIDAVDRTRNHLRLDVVTLMGEWEGTPRHPGAAALLRLAGDGVFDLESGGERRALEELLSRCEVLPDTQVQVLGDFRADFAYVFAGIVIEYHGVESHEGRMIRDANRTLALQQAGWYVIVLTKAMLQDPARHAAFIDRVRRQRERLIQTGAIGRPALPAQPERRLPLRTLLPAA